MFDPLLGDVTLFEGQVHDFNPNITKAGLFWTIFIKAASVSFDLGAGTATLDIQRLSMKDYFSLENSMIGPKNNRDSGEVSFRVEWTATGGVNEYDNPGQQFRGAFRDTDARLWWSGRSGDFEFETISTSATSGAELGTESNGSFYWTRRRA